MREEKKSSLGVLIGSAFILATSSVGPAFLTQTAQFTSDYRENFALGIFIAILFSWIAQLNFSRIIGVSNLRGQEIANTIKPGLGTILGFIVAAGGFFFNIGNIAGVSLGLTALTGLNVKITAAIAGIIGIIIFSAKNIGKIMDMSATIMGSIIIVLLLLITAKAPVPFGLAFQGLVTPKELPIFAILTLIGGTVGGFIPFSGAHRLIDAKVVGEENLGEINKSVNLGLLASALVRILMFLATLAVLKEGFALDPKNPAASPFEIVFGTFGLKLFGIVFACASLTSVIGNSFTSISFLKNFSFIDKNENKCIIAFIVISTILCIIAGQPALLLVLVGTVNAFILPFSLFIMLKATKNKSIVGDYEHSKILTYLGYLVILITTVFAILTLYNNIIK
ncbi:NRAMP family divalent metal transporter [Peptoniphilus lacrimalis]|uniref:NRAMP family divalent metal transporter n=1 Tax=Peptoniphilus lacrimalis TaxID=33031 RepID=UPI0023F84E77|nr:NRAMP family divalent metal transporter [Peptoniphilus lacrimalis]